MRNRRVLVAAGAIAVGALAIGQCGGDDQGAETGGTAGASDIPVRLADDIPSIVSFRDLSCSLAEDDRQVVVGGIVESSGDATHYVSITVRFVDDQGVRVDIASDSVSDLQVGEAARWEATTYTDDARDVVRCEVSATVG